MKDMMIDNISKAIDREARLDEMERKSEELEAQAGVFRRVATKLKKKFWWKNAKYTVTLAVVAGVVVLVVVLVILV